jgi:hypothetical protein
MIFAMSLSQPYISKRDASAAQKYPLQANKNIKIAIVFSEKCVF